MRLLITGACGHIGSALIRARWLNAFEEVILVDSMVSKRYSSLFSLPADVNFTFLEQDFIHLPSSLFSDDLTVIHLAAITDATQSVSREEETWYVNNIGTKVLAIRCAAAGSKLIFPSTTSVYGSQAEEVDETCEELAPQSPYAASKLAAEKYLQWAREPEGLKCCILRLGTIVGWSWGIRFHTVANKFVWQACKKEPLTVWNTAWTQQRPYLSLKDADRLIRFVCDEDIFDGQIYNAVSDNLTIERLVKVIESVLGRKVKITFVDSPIMNQLSYAVSTQKIRDKGFKFVVPLENEIMGTMGALRGISTWR